MGLLLLFFFFWKNNYEIKVSELETKTIVASIDIKNIGNNKDDISYRIWPKEYKCSFIINDASGLAANWKNLDNIKKDDTLIIQIQSKRINDLSNKAVDIPIYSLIRNGKPIYDLESYNQAQNKINKRWRIISLIMGILLTLRGLSIISSKTGFIMAGISAIIIITLRITGLYW